MIFNSIKQMLDRTGPAWIVSSVACGPGTLASVAIAGSVFGYPMLWGVILSAIFAGVAQALAARLALLSGRGLISLVDQTFGPVWGWIVMGDAVLATWLASSVLMKAVVDVTGLATGWSTPAWVIVYLLFSLLLVAGGGYPGVERFCQILIVTILLCFGITFLRVEPDWMGVIRGIVPSLPGDLQDVAVVAGVLGGAVHITIIAMHTYTVHAKRWDREDLPLAMQDILTSVVIGFGLYSTLVYLVAATVLHPRGIEIKNALDLAQTLEPFLGRYAHGVMILGLWGAAISTLTPTFLAAGYFVADKLGWPLEVKDRRFQTVVALGCLISCIGPFLGGNFVTLLVIMLALGLCGTPLALIILLALLNRSDVVGTYKCPAWLNLAGGVTLGVTTVIALQFVATRLGG